MKAAVPLLALSHRPGRRADTWSFPKGATTIRIRRVKWLDVSGRVNRKGMACGEVEANLQGLVPQCLSVRLAFRRCWMMRVSPVLLVLFVLMACGDSGAGERTFAGGHTEAAPDVVESDALEASAADDLEDDPEVEDQEEQMDEQFQALLEAQAAASKDPEALEVMARIESMLAEARAVDEAAEAARTDSPEVRYERGQPRDDLARFHGLYGDPADVGSAAKRLWVSDACGYLTIGATWGDVWPWVMRSVSDTAFIAAAVYPGVEPFEAEFRMASDGRAETLTHNGSLAIGNPLPRVGELPEGWDAEPPEGCDHRPR